MPTTLLPVPDDTEEVVAIRLPAGVNADELAVQIVDAINRAEAARSKYLTKLEKNRRILRAELPTKSEPWPGSCKLNLRVTYWTRQRIIAQIMEVIFGAHPYYNVNGQRPVDDQYAQKVETFLENLFTTVIDLEAVMDPIFQETTDAGCCGALYGWKRQVNRRTRRSLEPSSDLSRMQWKESSVDEVVDDRPDIRFFPSDRFGVYPASATSVDEATALYFIDSYTGNDLLKLSKTNFIDKAALQKLRNEAQDDVNPKSRQQIQNQRGISQSLPGTNFHTNTYELYIVYWTLPGSDDEPAEDYAIWIHPQSFTILHSEPNPAWDGKRPLVLFRMSPDKEGIYGDGIVDIVGDLELTMTTVLRQAIDQAAIDIAPPTVMDESARIPGEKYIYGPGQIWRMYGTGKAQVLDHTSQVAMGMQLITFLRDIVERYTGVTDTSMGLAAGPRQTATQSTLMSQQGSMLFNLVINRMRRSMNELAERVLWLCYQYAGNESVRQLWERLAGDEENPFELANNALGGRYYFKAQTDTETNGRMVKQSIYREVYDRLLANPLIQSNPLLMFSVTRRYLAALGVRLPEELIGKEEEIRSAMAAQAQAKLSALGQPEQEQMMQDEQQYANDLRSQAPQIVSDAIGGAMGVSDEAAPIAPPDGGGFMQ